MKRMTTNPRTTTLDPRLRSMLGALRWRIRAYIWIEGLAAAVIWLGATFWCAWALDYLPVWMGASEMPRGARIVVLSIIAGGLAYVLYHWVLRRTFVRLADHSMAVLLERRFRDFHDSLVTAVELAERPQHARDFDASMLQQTAQEARDEVQRVRVRDVFNFRPLLRKLIVAALAVMSVAVFYFWNEPAVATCVNRIYLLKNEPWPRQARIEVVGVEVLGPEDGSLTGSPLPLVTFGDRSLKVAKGSNLRLKVRADLSADVVPEVCTIYYRTAEGDRGRVTMNRMRRSRSRYQDFSFANKPLHGILSSVTFDVVGYDYRVRDYTIQVVDSPAIVSTQLECVFPAYMVDEENSLWLPRTEDLTGATQLPRGTAVTVRARANKPLRRVDLFDVATEQTTQLTVDPDGETPDQFEYFVERLDDNLTLDVTLYDADGVVTERPHRIFIPAVADEPPQLDVRLRGIGTAVTADVIVPATGTAADDYAVGRTWFDLDIVRAAPADGQEAGEHREFDFALQSGGQIDAAVDFRELRSAEQRLVLQPKDKIMLALQAEDKYDLGAAANRSSSDRYQLDVVTPDTLLAILEAREIGLRRRFEQIIDEMTQARDFLARVRSPVTDLGPEPADAAAGSEEPGDTKLDERQSAERAQSLRLLRTQQSLQQTRKSAQELLGVAASFLDIRAEIINNRVDTEDRKRRLKELIADPMQAIGEKMFPELEKLTVALEKVLLDDLQADRYDLGTAQAEAEAAVQQSDEILAALDQILQQMLDLETFNELLDIVRQLLKDQEGLIEETQQEREKGLLEELQGLQDLQ
jgi:hypothetical protein